MFGRPVGYLDTLILELDVNLDGIINELNFWESIEHTSYLSVLFVYMFYYVNLWYPGETDDTCFT